ncbi:erythromycin esterase [Halolamina pelagica]|uniref:Erythromycin esterase n=1 Tax=Halolamina pelagica TaxID=699431 RepID=A0A0P7HBU2_9EURY|nr:erythromycin esterase family protein [Halolamina pelagica]KPN30944.1 erythromycin esterase [Halolamina pelagica]
MTASIDDDTLYTLGERAVELDGDDPEAWRLDPVADALADATVIGMGEATHGTHEHFRLKAALFRRLVADHGVRLFGLEANYSETLAIDRYVRGTDDAPDSAADALAATYFWPWYVAELADLVEWLREFNAGRPPAEQVRFLGFDAQYAVGGAEALQPFLAEADPELLDSHRGTLEMLADWGLDTDEERELASRIEDAQRFLDAFRDRLADRRAEYVAATSERAVQRAERHRSTMADAVDLELTDSDAELLERRDRAMADGVDRLRDATPHDRIALWAHNAHVQRAPFDFEGEGTRTMGQHLAERYSEDYVAIGFSFTEGSYQAMAADHDGEYGLRDCVVDAAEGSIGGTLGRADGSPLFLDHRAVDAEGLETFLREERPLRQPGGMYDPDESYESDIVLADAFDALCHVDETTRAVPLGHPAEIDSWG